MLTVFPLFESFVLSLCALCTEKEAQQRVVSPARPCFAFLLAVTDPLVTDFLPQVGQGWDLTGRVAMLGA